MSTAATADAAAPAPKGKKKLLVIVAVAVLLLGGAAGGGLWWMKSKAAAAAAAEEAEEDGEESSKAAKKAKDPKAVPVFVPLDPFTVNLADRQADRYAQVGISLEVADTAMGDKVKVYMPAIRNNILMVLAQKTADEMLSREGKDKLAQAIRRESSRAMGYEVPAEAPAEAEKGASTDEPEKPKKRVKKVSEPLPIEAVHFSTLIIQ